jgi:O-methyltransferase domain
MQAVDPDAGGNRLIAELRDLILGGERAAMIHTICRCGIPDLLADGARTTKELAEHSDTAPDVLRRLLRALVPSGLFIEAADDKWGLTPMGEWLRPDRQGSLHPLAIYTSEPWMRRAWEQLEHGVRTGAVPFDVANGAPFFEYLDRHPDARGVFDSVMATYQTQRLTALADAYDWGKFGHIVDVGGGHGVLLFSLVRACPTLGGTVFDLPHIAAVAERHAAWEGLADRVKAVAGNFLTDIPPTGDALLLSRILHDWPDEACVRILRGCRAAMTSAGELLILERVIEVGSGQRTEKEADVHMHVVLGGKERTRTEFARLLTVACFSLERVVETSTTNQIVVGRPV